MKKYSAFLDFVCVRTEDLFHKNPKVADTEVLQEIESEDGELSEEERTTALPEIAKKLKQLRKAFLDARSN